MPDIGFNPNNPVGFKEITWADLQLVGIAANKGLAYFCPDAPGGGSCVMSDGVRWRPFALGIYRGSKVMASADGGVATFTYNMGWTKTAAPQVILIDAAGGGGRLNYDITAASKDGCTVTVKRGVTLPLVGGLLGFDVFAGGNVVGVTVFLIAYPME
jgi:hypothetical protein